MARARLHGWMARIVAAAMVLCSATAADGAWWTGTYYPTYRTAYYRAQPYYAYYGAAYAPATTAAACQTCRPAACGTCVQRVCSYVPQTAYRVAYRDVPVTSYHPVTTVDHCSGCAWTSYRPVTSCTRQAYYVPYTTYQQVCSNVAISTAPAAAYYAQPAVAVAAAPATGACCGGAAAATTPGAISAPAATSPDGSSVPQPMIEPSEQVPGAAGQSLLNETQSRNAPGQAAPGQPAPVQQTNGWRFGGPGPSVAKPTEAAPTVAAPQDRTAKTLGPATAYRPASLSKPVIQPARILPASAGQSTADSSGWRAAK